MNSTISRKFFSKAILLLNLRQSLQYPNVKYLKTNKPINVSHENIALEVTLHCISDIGLLSGFSLISFVPNGPLT